MQRIYKTALFLFMFLFSHSAYAGGTLSIASLTPSASIYVGETVSFSANASGFTNPTYLIEDNFGGTSIRSSNISASGSFSWVPASGDAGTHAIVVTAVDSLGNSANATQFITVSNPTVELSAPSPSSTIEAGTKVTFTTTATGFTSPSYTATDSFSGGTVTAGSVDASGNFSWTPSAQDAGTHTIGITVSDSLGHSITATRVIIVPAVTALTMTLQSLPTGNTVSPGQAVSFTAVVAGGSSLTYSVTDAFFPTTITSGNISASGVFTWTPTMEETGAHRITVFATDVIGRTVSQSVTLTVQQSYATISGFSPGSVAYVGNPITFSMITTGFSNPLYTVTDSFATSSLGKTNINSSGKFSWTPTITDVGVHTLSVGVTDTSGHAATTSQAVEITASPQIYISSMSPAGGVVSSLAQLVLFATTSGMTQPTYGVVDTFSGTSLTSLNINTNGKLSWVPKFSDVGIHQVTIYATESSGRSVSTSTSVTVLLSGAQNSSVPLQISSTYLFLTNLAFGSSGADVLALQNKLAALGYLTATPNGYFGYQTQAAVKKFQSANGLDSVGVVGPLTRAKLNGSVTTTIPASSSGVVSSHKFYIPLDIGSKGPEVIALQQVLTAKGYFSGEATGYYGPITQAAVMRYQAAHGLTQLGNVGPGTRAALNAE